MGFGVTFIGLSLGLVGDVLAYWDGSLSQRYPELQWIGFPIESLGVLMVLIGSVVLGVAYLRANVLPKQVPRLLIAAGPGGILLSLLHIPSGTMLLFCCAWVVLGYLLLTGRIASAEQPSRVS